jgi:transposase-like protein
MNLQAVFCPNPGCPDKYVKGKGNIISHGQKRPRCKCTGCGHTFTYRRGTPFFGLRSEVSEIICVVTLVAYGCPVAAIVAAFERDERTIARWLERCGHHAEIFHHQQMQPLDLQQVQVDEMWLRIHQQVMWLAMAIAVRSRLWLGAVCRPKRDKKLARQILTCVYNWAKQRPLVISFDGWKVYYDLCLRIFSERVYSGKRGGAPMKIWEHLTLVQVIKKDAAHQWLGLRWVLWGSCTMLQRLIEASQGAGTINTAYIERLNATFRTHLSLLVRRTRCPARRQQTVTERVFLLGCIYNFCAIHSSLGDRTPAMAAGLTDHRWAVADFLWFRPSPYLAAHHLR